MVELWCAANDGMNSTRTGSQINVDVLDGAIGSQNNARENFGHVRVIEFSIEFCQEFKFAAFVLLGGKERKGKKMTHIVGAYKLQDLTASK